QRTRTCARPARWSSSTSTASSGPTRRRAPPSTSRAWLAAGSQPTTCGRWRCCRREQNRRPPQMRSDQLVYEDRTAPTIEDRTATVELQDARVEGSTLHGFAVLYGVQSEPIEDRRL